MKDLHLKFWPKHLCKNLTIPETDLFFNLTTTTKRFANKVAINFYGNEMTYAELMTETKKIAGFIQKKIKLKKGDRVILDLQNSPQFIISYYAILSIGCVVVPINPMSVKNELIHYIKDSGAKLAFSDQQNYIEFKLLIPTILKYLIVTNYGYYIKSQKFKIPNEILKKNNSYRLKNVFTWHDILRKDFSNRKITSKPNDLASIIYTSGTTGKPKGCMHTNLTIMSTLVGSCLWKGLNQDTVSLATAPMFHVTGMQHSMNAIIYSGGTIVILPRWDPATAGLMIEKFNCTHWANVPTMVIDLLADSSTQDRDLSSLKNIFGGGSSMPKSVAEKLYQRCRVKYMEGYGMTETISQTHLNPHEYLRKQCLGIPTFNTKSFVIDTTSGKILPPNKLGEIVVHGPQIMKGYWRNPKANDETFTNIKGLKFLKTGDLGYYDKSGFFYIADRLKRMINTAGYKVWPAEVESILYKNPKVMEVAIISKPDIRKGETVKAVVVIKKKYKDKTSEQSIISWSKKNMSNYKVPRYIEFKDKLPRSGSGKIQWKILQDKEWEIQKKYEKK